TAVLEHDHTVYNALRMNHYLYLLGFEAKEPPGFYHLEALVHQRSRVDGDLGAHAPIGMLQRVVPFYIDQEIGFLAEKGPAGSGENDLFDAVSGLADQALKDGAMLGIHRDDGGLLLERLFHDDVPRNDERLLVGEGNGLSLLNRPECRPEPRKSDDGGE